MTYVVMTKHPALGEIVVAVEDTYQAAVYIHDTTEEKTWIEEIGNEGEV